MSAVSEVFSEFFSPYFLHGPSSYLCSWNSFWISPLSSLIWLPDGLMGNADQLRSLQWLSLCSGDKASILRMTLGFPVSPQPHVSLLSLALYSSQNASSSLFLGRHLIVDRIPCCPVCIGPLPCVFTAPVHSHSVTWLKPSLCSPHRDRMA